MRELISLKLAETEPWLSGEIEVDESYFGGSRKGKRGRGAAGKVPVFGLLKRGGKVHVVIIPNAQQNTLIPIIRRTIEPDSIVYTDGFLSYDALDVSEFRHHRINRSEKFVVAETTSTASRTSGTRRSVIYDASMAFPWNTSISL